MIRVASLLSNYDDFGAIAPLLADITVNDILVNGYNDVYVERDGVLEKTDVMFKN